MFSYNSGKLVFPDQDTYAIVKRIISYASRVFFIYDEQIGQYFCVKMLRPRYNDLYRTANPLARARCLLEGFYFNRQCAPGVYLGIAAAQLIMLEGEDDNNAHAITLEKVLSEPHKGDLQDGKEYALIMRRLDDTCQLSNLLQNTFANEKGMEFLSREIYEMHHSLSMYPQNLAKSSKIGSIERLAKKLNLNKDLFRKAVASLSFSEEEKNRYHGIISIIDSVYKDNPNSFLQREKKGHIKRCHGDLKASNLWVYPIDVQTSKARLLALDCIDFKPGFCHIDTLSDIAMLAVDIEFYLAGPIQNAENEARGKALVTYFLECYLKYTQELQPDVWLLLGYYMLEKAMVNTYVNILYDAQIGVGKQYLLLAYAHAENLRTLQL